MRLFLQNNSAWEGNVSDNEGDVGDIAGSDCVPRHLGGDEEM